MPYALKFYLYIGISVVVVAIIADQWLRGFSAPIVLTFGAAYGIVMIVGRWLFGRKTL